MIMPAAAALLGTGGHCRRRIRLITKDFRARNRFEYFVKMVLIACSAVAILTTIGIVFSVLFETLAFFGEVSPIEFLFGTHWSPTSTPASFGFIPLLVGTLLITFIAVAGCRAPWAFVGDLHGGIFQPENARRAEADA